MIQYNLFIPGFMMCSFGNIHAKLQIESNYKLVITAYKNVYHFTNFKTQHCLTN